MENNILNTLKIFFGRLFDNKLFLAFIFFIIIFLFSFIFLFFPRSSQEENIISKATITPQSENLTNNKKTNENLVKSVPKVYFKNYQDKSANSKIIKNNFNYTLKYNFSKEEVLLFANKLGLNYEYKDKPGNENVLLYNLLEKEKKGVLEFNKTTGSFKYQSFGDLKPSIYSKNQSFASLAVSFLKDVDLFDETISCTNSYQRKNNPLDPIFVECHRDWRKIGSPIVSLGGVLNIPENKKIADLNIGLIDDAAPTDPDVINVKLYQNGNQINNSKDNGKSRPNDFNTITIGFANDGRILSVDSNIRWIDKRNILEESQIITKEEALNYFQSHKAEFSLTIPAGLGIINYEKFYPDNKAIAQNAIINEISLVYLEKPAGKAQEEYNLSFLIRGTAMLESGYTVRFAQTIPALKSKLALIKTTDVAGVKIIAQQKKIQLDTFTPGQNYVPPGISITPTPIPTIYDGPQLPSECSTLEGINLRLNIPGYGVLILAASVYESGYHTFFFKSSNFATELDKELIKKIFFASVEDQYVINVSRYIRDKNPAFSNINDLYNLYGKINNSLGRFFENNPFKNCAVIINPYEAPIPPGCPKAQNYDMDRMFKIAENVANRLLDLKSQNKINEWAAKENLFADSTLRAFYMVFADASWDPRGLPEKPKFYACYLTGGSPVLYFYPINKTDVSIKISAPLVYADPSIINNTWKVISTPDGTIEQNGITRHNLYYEYDKSKVPFEEPEDGFVVETGKWKEFIRENLSLKFGLNAKETGSLIMEINSVLSDSPNLSNFPYLKLSLIPQSELNKKLPLSINPKPDNIYRINVFVKPVSSNLSNWTNLSNLPDIKRNGFTVVEIGASSK